MLEPEGIIRVLIFYFLATPKHMEFPGQGSDLNTVSGFFFFFFLCFMAALGIGGKVF